jgi:hypothetical protein
MVESMVIMEEEGRGAGKKGGCGVYVCVCWRRRRRGKERA